MGAFDSWPRYIWHSFPWWDIAAMILSAGAFYCGTTGFQPYQWRTLSAPMISASVSLFAVMVATLAMIVSLLKKETLEKLGKKPKLVLKPLFPFLVATVFWVISLTLQFVGFLAAIATNASLTQIFLTMAVLFLTYSIVVLPQMVWEVMGILAIQAKHLSNS